MALLTRLGLDDRSQVIDLGAGTGQFTLESSTDGALVLVEIEVNRASHELA